MIKITLNVYEEGDVCTGGGESFGHAALDLIEQVSNLYGSECLDDGILFEGLSELVHSDNNKYSHYDFSVPEQDFTLTLVNKT